MKVGHFIIPRELYETEPDAVMAHMGKCLILQAIPTSQGYTFDAICDLFDDIDLGSPVPYYSIDIEEHNGKYTITAQRVQHTCSCGGDCSNCHNHEQGELDL